MTSGPAAFLRIWLLLVAATLFVHLGSAPLFDADEGRNAEVAREMAATNDYVMPRIDGMPYLDKPVVYFAAEAAAMEVLGPTELAARLPACLFTLATALVVFWFARRTLGSEEAYVAAIAFLSMPLTLAFSRTVIFDSALTFFMVVAIVALYFAVEEGTSPTRFGARGWRSLAWASIALGVLTKGPVAILVPLLVAIPYSIRRRRGGSIWSIGSFVLFIAIIAPWVWAVSRVVPDFLRYVLVTETAQRLTTGALKRTGPPWYFVPYVLGGALPWSIAVFNDRGSRLGADRRNVRFFTLLWILLPFVFFSLSQSKRPQYIVPVMPAIALLLAHMWNGDRLRGGLRVAAVAILVLAAILFAVPFVHLRMEPGISGAVQSSAMGMGTAALAGGLVALFAAKRREIAFAALTIPIVTIPLLANPLMNAIGERRSARSLAEQLRPRITAQTPLIGISTYTGSLQFYLGRPIVVVTPDAEEFTSNYIIRHYASFADAPSSPVRRPSSLRIDGRAIYFARWNDRATRAMLERDGLAVIAEGARQVAYGSVR